MQEFNDTEGKEMSRKDGQKRDRTEVDPEDLDEYREWHEERGRRGRKRRADDDRRRRRKEDEFES